MPRYVTRANIATDDIWTPDDRPTLSVIVEDREPLDTGLVDAGGVRIFRVSERAPMGFRTGECRIS